MDNIKEPKSKHFKPESTSDSTDEDDVPRFTLEAMANLPLLPDDVLLCIMKYLGPIELSNLSKITERLSLLATDKNLWKSIDFRPHKLTSEEIWKYTQYFKLTTKFLAVRGFVSEAPDPRWREEVLTPHLLQEIRIKCPNLETLILDEHFGVAFKLGLDLFPPSVRHLSMKGCVVTDLDPYLSYFQKMHIKLPHIKVLILSNCSWVSPHDFMAISKCYQLEELRMDGCPQLGECVAYTSLAARFGFHSLKILDLRNTRMGDSDVGCFNRSRNLTHLYLQCPSSDNEVVDVSCDDPTCMDQSFRDDFMDSSDDDDFGPVWFPRPVLLRRKMLPISMPSTIPARRANKSHRLDSGFVIASRSDPCAGSPSTSFCSTQRQNSAGEENGDPNLPQASTSHGTLNIVYNPAGPSAFRSGRKLESPKKHPSGDSDSSSDENFLSSLAFTTPSYELHNHTWMLEDSYLPSSQVDGGNRGTKRRLHSRDRSPSPRNIEPSTSSNPHASRSNNFRIRDFVRGSSASSMPGSAESVEQQKLVSESSSTSAEELNVTSDSAVSKVSETKSNEPEQGRSSSSRGSHSRPRCRKVSQRCKFPGPHLFRLPHHEPTNESTISDLCIMSFVLNDNDTDGAGYVRIISPQLVSSRPQLETLVVKNYKMITDASLTYLLKLSSLRYLDVSGTSVTEVGVLQFQLKRPDVEVVSDFKYLPV